MAIGSFSNKMSKFLMLFMVLKKLLLIYWDFMSSEEMFDKTNSQYSSYLDLTWAKRNSKKK